MFLFIFKALDTHKKTASSIGVAVDVTCDAESWLKASLSVTEASHEQSKEQDVRRA